VKYAIQNSVNLIIKASGSSVSRDFQACHMNANPSIPERCIKSEPSVISTHVK